jgi:DNA-binding PadR family transcriptional regulator
VTDHLTSFFPAGRDRGVTVAVEGFFAFVWFGWGQAAPPSWLVVPLAVGGGLAVLLTVAGVVLTIRSAGRLRVMSDPAVRRRYSIIVGLEFGLLGTGAAVLGATGQQQWIPVWICAGVGVHFFPLASTLANRSLRLLGVLLIAVAARPSDWRHGYDLARETGLKSGTLYPILVRLADRELVEACWEEGEPAGRPRRHLYRFTSGGLTAATAALAGVLRAAPSWPTIRASHDLPAPGPPGCSSVPDAEAMPRWPKIQVASPLPGYIRCLTFASISTRRG